MTTYEICTKGKRVSIIEGDCMYFVYTKVSPTSHWQFINEINFVSGDVTVYKYHKETLTVNGSVKEGEPSIHFGTTVTDETVYNKITHVMNMILTEQEKQKRE